jgi:hypothetical protein
MKNLRSIEENFLPSTISVALIIELLQKFNFGKSEKIRGKI